MITEPAFDELGTDELHVLMTEAIRELPETNPVRRLWERLDEILTAGGIECLPAPWDGYSEPEGEERDPAATNGCLRSAVTDGVGAAIRSVHQRGYEVALPLELLEFLTGGAETASVGEPEAVPRDDFEVVNSALSDNCQVAEGLRCTKCGAITTQAGREGQGWTLARLDLMADRHRCSPRVPDSGSSLDEVQDCTCVEFCNEDPKTACTLSGRRHVHPASHGTGFGPCPVHLDAPGDV
ncbi:hypothetical protein QF035_008903 [Streptomyces umbrinus]|uniref:Uncharacterized protein n=1 Tax=Streptomyces umbrinus TaxID=67370 RepID=A0ABU0T686_9ACTN|nr:hypothetical protein [Streptomyces umbrinus]MDQ1031321.1 hypothetical protein [Streptomyces umbrinus]